jgi:hypothetical protein
MLFFAIVLLASTALYADEFSDADTNKDGTISKEEFAAYIAGGAVTLPDALIQGLSDASAALAKDDLAGYQKSIPIIQTAVKQTTGAVRATLLPLSERLILGKDLASARKPFEPLSNAAANFVAAQPPERRQAKVFQCTMTPVLTVGRWIQKDNPKLQNPFHGSVMLTCGSEVKN